MLAWLSKFASIVRRLSLPANCAYSKAINWFCVVSRRTLLFAAELVHQAIQHIPRHELQNRVKYCIVVGHGVGSFLCLDTSAKRQNTEEIHAMRHVHKN